MLITCTNCATSYQVSASSLGPSGRSVRCARCQHVWFAANTEIMADVAQAHRDDLAWIAEAAQGAEAPPPQAPPAPRSHDPFAWPEPAAQAEPAPATEAAADVTMPPAPEPPPPEVAAPDLTGPEPPAPEPFGAPPLSEADAPSPVVVSDAPPLAPTGPTEPGPAQATETPAGEDIESVALRRAQRLAAQRRRWQRSTWTSVFLTLAAINLMLVSWRADVVRWLPQTASLFAAIGLPVNLRGLVFTNVTSQREAHEGVDVLVVEGTIVNDSGRAVEVPRLRFSVRNQMDHELYSWTALASRNALRPGETLPFRSHLASPPRDSERVLVRFFNRRDLVAQTP